MNLESIVTEIADPRFSTEEMENSRTKCGIEFNITSLYFDDDKPHFPSLVRGSVTTADGHPIAANWDQHGECRFMGERIKAFDLIRTTRQEIDSSRITGTLMLLAPIAIIIYAIFNL